MLIKMIVFHLSSRVYVRKYIKVIIQKYVFFITKCIFLLFCLVNSKKCTTFASVFLINIMCV